MKNLLKGYIFEIKNDNGTFLHFFRNVLQTTITLSTVISIFRYSVHNVT